MISLQLITEERRRQVKEKGYDDKRDDSQDTGELIQAAQCYLDHVSLNSKVMDISDSYNNNLKLYRNVNRPENWPPEWTPESWNPDSPIRDLVKAAALIAAEIDRRLRIPDKF
jgi:hypothetical protein